MTTSDEIERIARRLSSNEIAKDFNKVTQEGYSLLQKCKEISKMEKELKEFKIQLNNLNILSRLNPILTTILKSSQISEETRTSTAQLLNRIIISILQSNVILEE